MTKYFAKKIKFLLIAITISTLFGCVSAPEQVKERSDKPVPIFPFSAASLANPHPPSWQPWIISRFNRRTEYKMVELDGKNVLSASSDKAASGLLQEVSIDPTKTPFLRWRWKVPQILPGANLLERGADDSPARLIVSFDGDLEKLDVDDRASATMVKLFSGREMPYATLMYVWDNQLPPDSLIDNAYSTRAKMIVVETGAKRIGQWLDFRRDLINDFRRAFGEEPGKIISIGVMTDSNRTESQAIAYYGDIFLNNKP